MNVKMEQRVKVKFCIALNKTTSEIYNLLQGAQASKEGREEVDDTRLGRPLVQKWYTNVEKIGEVIRKDWRLSIQELTCPTSLNISKVIHIFKIGDSAVINYRHIS